MLNQGEQLNKISMAAGQARYDEALPVDPPECPDMKPLAEELLDMEDTYLIDFETWAESADEEVGNWTEDRAFFVRLLLKCHDSKDSSLGDFVEGHIEKLREHAQARLAHEWDKQ